MPGVDAACHFTAKLNQNDIGFENDCNYFRVRQLFNFHTPGFVPCDKKPQRDFSSIPFSR